MYTCTLPYCHALDFHKLFQTEFLKMQFGKCLMSDHFHSDSHMLNVAHIVYKSTFSVQMAYEKSVEKTNDFLLRFENNCITKKQGLAIKSFYL